MSTHSFIANLQSRREDYVKRLNSLVEAVSGRGVMLTGARVYEQMAEFRWKLDAIAYVQHDFEDGVTPEKFLAVLDGIRRDLIGAGGYPQGWANSEPPAYWNELGKIERDMRMNEDDARRELREKSVAESVRA